MKYLWLSVFLLLIFISIVTISSINTTKNQYVVANATYLVYVAQKDKVNSINNVQDINDLGFCYEAVASSPIEIDDSELMGRTTRIYGNESELNKLIEKLCMIITKRYYVDNILVLEGTTKHLFNGSTKIQIALNNKTISIGRPTILGAY